MFLPIGDEPNLRGTPYITWGLIALNCAVFVLVSLPLMGQGVDPNDPMAAEYIRGISRELGVSPLNVLQRATAYDVFTYSYGFRPADPSLLTLLSSMFLHGGWAHLLGNMLFLYIYGDNVELHLGRGKYLLAYLGTGAAATLFFAMFAQNSNIPLVGASGAISGVLGCYFVWFPRNVVRVVVVLFFILNVVRIPARWVLGFYLIADNLLPFLIGGTGGGVAHGAHIGGFLGGLGVAYGFEALRSRSSIWSARPKTKKATETRSAEYHVDSLHPFLRVSDYVGALDFYAQLPSGRQARIPARDIFALADGLVEIGHVEAALTVLQRFIATHPTDNDLAEAHLRAGMIQLHRNQRLPSAYQHFLSALDLNPSPNQREEAREGLALVEAMRRRTH